MPEDEKPQSSENPLTEVARTVGSKLGTAASRVEEMLRAAAPKKSPMKKLAGAKKRSTAKARVSRKAGAKKKSARKSQSTTKRSAARKKSRSSSARKSK